MTGDRTASLVLGIWLVLVALASIFVIVRNLREARVAAGNALPDLLGGVVVAVVVGCLASVVAALSLTFAFGVPTSEPPPAKSMTEIR